MFPCYFVEVFSSCVMSTPKLFCPLHTLAISRYMDKELFFISLFFYVSVAYWYIFSDQCWTQEGWQLLILAFSARKGTCSLMPLHNTQTEPAMKGRGEKTEWSTTISLRYYNHRNNSRRVILYYRTKCTMMVHWWCFRKKQGCCLRAAASETLCYPASLL